MSVLVFNLVISIMYIWFIKFLHVFLHDILENADLVRLPRCLLYAEGM